MRRTLSPERISFALLMELIPLAIAATAVGLWYAVAVVSGTDGGLLFVVLIFAFEFFLSMAFLVSGLGWIVIAKPLPAITVLVPRFFIVLFLYSGALDRWFHPDGCNGPCPRLSTSFYLALIASLAIPAVSALSLWLAATGQDTRQGRV